MSSRQHQQSPEQATQSIQGTRGPEVPAVSNAARNESLQNGNIIEALFSNDYMVEPSDSTTVLVQSSNDRQVSWATKWEAPNGFVKEEKVAQKGPTLNVPFTFSEAAAAGELNHGDRVSVTVFAEYGGQRDSERREFIIHIPTEELQVWEVFFDNQDQDSDLSGARRLDPLVFDLNRDGKLDTTDGSQTGNGQMDSESVLFDIDPSRESVSGWRRSSPGHRPGYYEGKNNSQVPAVVGGKAVYDTGKEESTDKHGAGRWTEDPSKGSTAKIYDAEGNLVGYWDKSKWGKSHGGRIGQYYWEKSGANRKEERTEWLKGTGDGFLVWDINGNGKIDSNTEMMSEFDAEGNKVFENGFEKLQHYFDKDNNGVIEGAELSELKFWVDDGDAKTEEGELRELSEFGIQKITIPKKGELTSTTTATKEELLPPKS
jgi:hypothetical protein